MTMLQDVFGHLPDPAPADVIDRGESLHVIVDLPGIPPETLSLEGTPTQLHIEARRPETAVSGKYRINERGRYLDRVIDLPMRVDPATAQATLTDGVLEVMLTKTTADMEATQ